MKKKITMSIPISKLWQFLRCFLLDFSWRINVLFLRRSEFFLCCLYLLLLSITLTERDLYLLKADESHLDWLAKKKASLATKQEQKKQPRVLEAERIKYIYKNIQNKGSIYITFYKYYLPSTSSFIGHLFCYNEIFVFWSHLFPIIFSHRVIHTERIEISGLFFKAALHWCQISSTWVL